MGIRTTSGPSATTVPPHGMGRQRMLTRRVHVRFSDFAPHTPARRSRGAAHRGRARRRNRQATSDVAGRRRGWLPGQITYDSVDSSAPQSGAVGVGEHRTPVVCHDQHRGRALAAEREPIQLGEAFLGLYDVDTLGLEVLRRGGRAARLEDRRELLVRNLPTVIGLAGEVPTYHIAELHVQPSFPPQAGAFSFPRLALARPRPPCALTPIRRSSPPAYFRPAPSARTSASLGLSAISPFSFMPAMVTIPKSFHLR